MEVNLNKDEVLQDKDKALSKKLTELENLQVYKYLTEKLPLKKINLQNFTSKITSYTIISVNCY